MFANYSPSALHFSGSVIPIIDLGKTEGFLTKMSKGAINFDAATQEFLDSSCSFQSSYLSHPWRDESVIQESI